MSKKLFFRSYCKYNYNNEFYKSYSEGLGSKTSELLHFLKKMNSDKFWEESKNPYVESSSDSKLLYHKHNPTVKNFSRQELLWNASKAAHTKQKQQKL